MFESSQNQDNVQKGNQVNIPEPEGGARRLWAVRAAKLWSPETLAGAPGRVVFSLICKGRVCLNQTGSEIGTAAP